MPEMKLHIPQIEKTPKPKSLIGIRHYQYLLMFFTTFACFTIRTSLSVAIIPMTAETPPDPSIPTYPEWDNIDVILSSFFWGYFIPQVSAGQLSERFGPKWFFVGTMIIASTFNLVIPPMAASLGSTGVMVCRVIHGLSQGFLYPSVHNLISRWAPLQERARVSNFVYSGGYIGIVVSMVVTGAIGGSELGWPVAFYLFGGLGLLWTVIFAIFVENSPANHKRISEEEKGYIESSNSVTAAKKVPTPWKSIFGSLRIWAIFVAGVAQCWGSYTLFTEIPSYMDGIMNFDIKSGSQLSAIPYAASLFVGLAASFLADKLVSKKILSITNTRKVFNSMAMFLPTLSLIWLAFIDSSQKDLAVVLLVVAVGSGSCVYSGYMVNMIDLAPNHSGTITGLINGSTNIFSILGPLSVGLLGSDKTDPLLWRKVFLLSAGIYLCCGTFYCIFASGEVQSWNNIEENESQEDTKSDIKKK